MTTANSSWYRVAFGPAAVRSGRDVTAQGPSRVVSPRELRGALLVLGTSSGAGKSTIVTGLCRMLARRGVSVAPFKAQNMSLNSFVTRDGGEMGRAQVVQAQAAGVEPDVLMNPILLKPGSDTRSQMIVLGAPVGELDAATGWAAKGDLLEVVVESYRTLRRRYDVVIAEGAGSPAEINLRASDLVNLGFARAAHVPAILVGDIDRGGLFASFVGTLAVLDDGDAAVIRAFVVNKFRGSVELLRDGLDELSARTARPVLGVVPHHDGLELDAEDAVDLRSWRDGAAPLDADVLTVGVIALPRASNVTDVEPLAAEPGLILRALYHGAETYDCDLVIIPGTRATVADLAWLRARRFDEALTERATKGRAVLGICGGYQMLGGTIDDDVESAQGRVEGLGLLPVRTIFQRAKTVRQRDGVAAGGERVRGYEIRHGDTLVEGGAPFLAGEGCRVGAIAGTSWHGIFENDEWRRSFLALVAEGARRTYRPDHLLVFAQRRAQRLDLLADLLEEHLDVDTLLELIESDAHLN